MLTPGPTHFWKNMAMQGWSLSKVTGAITEELSEVLVFCHPCGSITMKALLIHRNKTTEGNGPFSTAASRLWLGTQPLCPWEPIAFTEVNQLITHKTPGRERGSLVRVCWRANPAEEVKQGNSLTEQTVHPHSLGAAWTKEDSTWPSKRNLAAFLSQTAPALTWRQSHPIKANHHL